MRFLAAARFTSDNPVNGFLDRIAIDGDQFDARSGEQVHCRRIRSAGSIRRTLIVSEQILLTVYGSDFEVFSIRILPAIFNGGGFHTYGRRIRTGSAFRWLYIHCALRRRREWTWAAL
jgi:hypothetical protein